MKANNEFIEEILAGTDIALIGFADLSEIDVSSRHGFPYGICIATALRVFPSTTSEPSREYYEEYRRVSRVLRKTSIFLADKIMERGFMAHSMASEKQNEDFRTSLPFKTLATRAGLGWIGKSATLITKEYGNAIRLNGVLTDMPLMTTTPINSSLCGMCDECVKHCPGKAITGNMWNLHADREDLLHARDCKRTVVERGRRFDVTEGSCGICIAVCPWTKQYKKRSGG